MNDQLVDSAETLQLLEKATSHRVDALESLFQRHVPAIRRSIERRVDSRLRPRLDASDIVQETRKYAFQNFDDFMARRPMPFRLWLLKTAYQRLTNIERDHIATAKRSVAREVPLPDRSSMTLASVLVGKTVSPSNELLRNEIAATVRRCLAELPEQDRQILFLRNFDGLSNLETATLLGLKPETTKKRCTRALLRLRALLEAEGLGEEDV